MKIRIGQGYDVHQLAEGLPFVLGGVHIEHSHGLVAHSDGDVLLHSICDAILGAAAMRDIGYHFPDNSNEFKNIDSRILLRKTKELISANGWEIGNIDATICLQKPKLLPHIPQMCKNIADDLQIDISDVSVKATTTEKLGFVGREEGVAVFAVALIQKQ
ncbi:MAG: 2-C-methyl-D-erythritol 2,4-cyclodiphosphate synthase [Bacteroidales bacterium]|nr:2-C-methyl-D-erythritol 2,4-cyclodiphosphate synthase [Bacteroidales bacterium]MBQ3676484.1 2-C-methyl-D-erythritol 2,4-cyclodiphosphate synthase [Bacteroidales bacterium]MBR4497824.1 2-C-methyl-D-erythritol 2,4-cyclodiphosphate synthase [Bacteroidales bacterium]MBR4689849.1 2-C-methyl-D-erythritol 2,4-cyclodiphosphate synthase [Bacteroidales bacterium]MBR7035137.1 2-C-methyl-D-erythritol 2,4-cyclodiphosphate synthase [Bacteroidales bacterium]